MGLGMWRKQACPHLHELGLYLGEADEKANSTFSVRIKCYGDINMELERGVQEDFSEEITSAVRWDGWEL